MDKNVRLSTAVHAVNTTIGPNGLTPSLLLFGATPRLPIPNVLIMAPTQKQQFEAMRAARQEMETITMQRRVAAALKHRTGVTTHPMYETSDKVRIWREASQKYEGPHIVHSYDNRKTVFVHSGNRIVPFSISVLKRVYPEENSTQQSIPPDIITELEQIRAQYGDLPSPLANPLAEASYSILAFEVPASEISRLHEKGATLVYATIVVHNRKDPRFNNAKIAEIQELIKKGTYEFVKESDIPANATILQSRFVLTMKNSDNPDQYFKARLVLLGHIDPDKPRVVNEAPTVLKSSIRFAIALIVSHGFNIWSRDISQAFLQSEDPLRRTVYVRPPKGENILERIGADTCSLLHAIKPQYGLSYGPGYWWQTFRRWHV